jgi:hypothetical protein
MVCLIVALAGRVWRGATFDPFFTHFGRLCGGKHLPGSGDAKPSGCGARLEQDSESEKATPECDEGPWREPNDSEQKIKTNVTSKCMGVWQGVAMDSLKIHTGTSCPSFLGCAGGPPLKLWPAHRAGGQRPSSTPSGLWESPSLTVTLLLFSTLGPFLGALLQSPFLQKVKR